MRVAIDDSKDGPTFCIEGKMSRYLEDRGCAWGVMSFWQPIATAPKDGSYIVGTGLMFSHPEILVWKTNVSLIDAATRTAYEWLLSEGGSAEYFGRPGDDNDWRLSTPVCAATSWFLVPPTGDALG